MKNLLIVSYTRDIPPFIRGFIDAMYANFDSVIYLTPEVRNGDDGEFDEGKAELRQFKTNYKNIHSILKCFGVVKNGGLRCIGRAAKTGRLTLEYIKHIATQEVCSESLVREASRIVKDWGACNTVVLAEWFAPEALAVAKLRKKWLELETYALAHSYEVTPQKCPYVDISFNEFKHSGFDQISFISSTIYDLYCDTVHSLNIDFSNVSVCHLGSINRQLYCDDYKFCSSRLRLVSCSAVCPLKRVEMIALALRDWQGLPINWIHIGDGDTFGDLKKLVNEVSNEKVEITLMGRLTNRAVAELYHTEQVDLFINVSTIEGVPISVMEAQSEGIPALVTDVGGNGEIIHDGFNGVVIPGDIEPCDISNALYRYIAFSDAKKRAMRRNSRKNWEKEFNADKNSARFLDGAK